MSKQPCCGCPVTIFNPPEFGAADRLPQALGYPATVPIPADPSLAVPKVLNPSYAAWQGTSLGCVPESTGWQPRYPMTRGLPAQVWSSFRNYGLNFASSEIASLLGQIIYAVPGIWIGPIRIHLPSGNVLLQLPVPISGPCDPVPVYTYNSMAARDTAGRGFGVSDLFNPTVEHVGQTVNMITGTGAYLEYGSTTADDWAIAPGSTRNALYRASDGTFKERQPDGFEWLYDTEGLAEKIVAPNGSIWTISRDGDCFVSGIEAPSSHASGRETLISGDGGTFAVTQPGNRKTTFTLAGGELIGVTYPGGGGLSLGYTGEHLLSNLIDPNGNSVGLTYDARQRVKSATYAGNQYHFKYIDDSYGGDNFIEVTDPAGHVTTVTHDCNVVLAVENPKKEKTTYSWEPGVEDPRLISIEDALTNKVTLSYESHFGVKSLKKIQRPVVGTMQFDYEPAYGKCTKVTDYDGNITNLLWDTMQRRTKVTDAEGKQFEFDYQTGLQLRESIDPYTNKATINYDASNGCPSSTVNEISEQTNIASQTDGLIQAVTDPLSHTTTFVRDQVGRVTQVVSPISTGNTRTEKFDRKPGGQLWAYTNGENEKTTFSYEGQNQLSQIQDPLLNSNDFSYDSRGNLETAANGEDETTTFSYDNASRQTEVEKPLQRKTQFEYDAVGNTTKVTNAESEATKFYYDAAYRQTLVETPLKFKTTFAYNKDSLQTRVENPEHEVTTTTYTNVNNVSTVAMPLGRTVGTVYDDLHRPVQVIDPTAAIVTTEYDAASRITKVIEPLGYSPTLDEAATITKYDAANRVTEVVNAGGYSTKTEYDFSNRPTQVEDPLGHKVQTQYDKADRVTLVINAENEKVTSSYDDAGRLTQTIEGLPDHITTFAYDRADRQTQITNAENEVATTVYDAAGRVTQTKRGGTLNIATNFEYDKVDRLTREVDAENGVTTLMYDDDGRKTKVVNTRQKSTDFEYDDANRLTREANAIGAVTTIVYDGAGRQTETQLKVDGVDRVTKTQYDLADRVTMVTDPKLNDWSTTYYSSGQVASTSDPLGNTATIQYDILKRVVTETNAESENTIHVYDAGNREIKVTDNIGNSTEFKYDKANRLTEVITPYGTGTASVVTKYDDAGNPIVVTNQRSKKTTFTYDKVNRKTGVENPLFQTQSFAFDEAGRQTYYQDAMAQVTLFKYDKLDRQTEIQLENNVVRTFGYDAMSNRTAMTDGTGSYVYNYDDIDRQTYVYDSLLKTITYTYNEANERKTMLDPDAGTVTSYDYDLNGNLTNFFATNEVGPTTFHYDDANRRTQMTFATGTLASYGFDKVGRVTSVQQMDSSLQVLSQFDYTLDGVGNRTFCNAINVGPDVSQWEYDDTYQLKKDHYFTPSGSTTPLAGSLDFEYDETGNRTKLTEAVGGGVTTSVYDDANRLLTAEDASGVTTYTYDANGCRLTIEEPSGHITTNYWNQEKRLTRVEKHDGSEVEYLYNEDGLLIKRTEDGTDEELYIYDGNNRLIETDGLGTPKVRYAYVPAEYGEVFAQDRYVDGKFYYHSDGIKNIRMLTDALETVTDDYSYDGFGKDLSATGATENCQRYKGEFLAYKQEPEADPSMQYAMHYRGYDVETGTFLSEDPAEDDLNLFRYVSNNPVNRSDPSGLADDWMEWIDWVFTGKWSMDAAESVASGTLKVAREVDYVNQTAGRNVIETGAAMKQAVEEDIETANKVIKKANEYLRETPVEDVVMDSISAAHLTEDEFNGLVYSFGVGIVEEIQETTNLAKRSIIDGDNEATGKFWHRLNILAVSEGVGSVGGRSLGKTVDIAKRIEIDPAATEMLNSFPAINPKMFRLKPDPSEQRRLELTEIKESRTVAPPESAPKRITTSGIDEQLDVLVKEIPGLDRAQARVLLEQGFKRDSSVVFGGSRVRGNSRPDSDLDVGFGSLSKSQARKILDKAQDAGGLNLERTLIVPGNEDGKHTQDFVT